MHGPRLVSTINGVFIAGVFIVRRLKSSRCHIIAQGNFLVVYLAAADKYRRLTQRLSQEQKGLDERVLMVSQWPSHLW